MTLKNAALLALIGTVLMTAFLVWTFLFNFLQSPAGLGTCGFTVLVIHLCVWLLQRDGVLFRVP
jgi:hypothetical protein